MFQNAYQGGSFVDIYDVKVNKDKEKSYMNLYRMTTPQGFSKIYDKDIKGYIYSIDGHSTKMRFPKEDKVDLCIVQHFLVLQIYLPFGSPWNLEIGIADTSKVNRRINLVSALNKIETKYFHVKVPNDIVKRGVWLNLSIDVNSFMEAWKGQTFRSIDSLTIGSTCKLRRVYSMKNPLLEFSTDQDQEEQMHMQSSNYSNLKPEDVPKNFSFPPGFPYMNQVINYQKIMENVDPKYLDNASASESVENLKQNMQASIPKNMARSTAQGNSLVKGSLAKPLKGGNSTIQKKYPHEQHITQDFQEKSMIGLKIRDNSSNQQRTDILRLQINSKQVPNDLSATGSNNFDEELNQQITVKNQKIRESSRDPPPPRSQIRGSKPPQQPAQQGSNYGTGPIGSTLKKQTLKSPITQVQSPQDSLKDNMYMNSKQSKIASLQKNKNSSLNNPWYVSKASRQLFGEQESEEIEENLEAEYYDKYEINEDLPHTTGKKREQKPSLLGPPEKESAIQNGHSGEKQTIPLKQQQMQRNIKSANNFVQKKSTLVQKGNQDQSQQKGQDRHEKAGDNVEENKQADMNEESYFQLTQKFNTVSDSNQFRDLFSQTQERMKNENADRHNDTQIEEDIEIDHPFNSPGGQRKKQPLAKNPEKDKLDHKKQQIKKEKEKGTRQPSEKKAPNFEDSLEGPYIERELKNGKQIYGQDMIDKYNTEMSEDQQINANNNSIQNYNIYENHLNKFIDNYQRPFTPPFQAVVTLSGNSIITKKNNQTVVIQNQMRDELNNGEMKNQEKSQKRDEVQPRNHTKVDENDQLEVIYDPVLNCYYDPNSKQYYELKS